MPNNAHILLDSCIINNLLSKKSQLVFKTKEILKDLVHSRNSFYISHLTKYELLRSISENKRQECEKLLSKIKQIGINDSRLCRAIHLYSLYKNHPDIKQHLASISDVDIFIGSLIFTNNDTYLLTADYKDFPRPFFRECEIWNIECDEKGHKSCLYYYLLKPNLLEFQ